MKKGFASCAHVGMICLLTLLGATSFATQDYLDGFIANYKIADDGALNKCATCHVSDEDFAFNPYGEAIKAKAQPPSAELFASIETDDSDGDGTLNKDEIASGSGDPGNPAIGGKPGTTPAPVAEKEKENPLMPENAWHPAIVHFPIGLFMAGLLLDFLGMIRKDKTLLHAGWYNIVLASVSSFAAVASGFVAMSNKGFPYRGTIMDHIIYTVGATICMAIMVGMRLHRHDKMNWTMRVAYYVLATLCLLGLSWAGHLGGVVAGTA